tara:strand:+ start:44958 stop:45245 length:288 start_codon:yes stop_codon:yes gene_type:complete
MQSNNITKHLRILGRVQGVYYRAWSVETATNFGLTGWVCNRKDGSVEALITGAQDAVERFITACYQGPDNANVETIQIDDGSDEGLNTFEFRDTQ